MTKDFQNLEEFEALRDDEKIDTASVDEILNRLCFKKLNGTLSRFVLIRRLRLIQWLKELGKITGTPPKLSLTREETTPYMQEGGLISFCKKDVLRADRLFMLLAHETAHFILMQDESYGRLKMINADYAKMPWREQKMHSPIELCANIITVMILERCKNVEKGRKCREKIEICVKSLKKQLTN